MSTAKCPRGHAGVVVKAGTYGPTKKPATPGGARPRTGPRRQLWWCYPHAKTGRAGAAVDKTDAHRFAEAMPRQLLPAKAAAHNCSECATELELHEGPPHVRGYEFAARSVAAALVAVGQGTSYHQAAKAARQVTGWGRRVAAGQVAGLRPGANGTLAGDWVGLFGPLVTDPVLGQESWPSVVALDDVPFGCSAPRRAAHLQGLTDEALRVKAAKAAARVASGRGAPLAASLALTRSEEKRLKEKASQALGWVIFGAWNPRAGHTGQLFRVGAGARLNSVEAAAFLLATPGRPDVVVCDGGGIWPKAVAAAWPPLADENGVVTTPTPRIVDCEWHLKARLRGALRASGVLPPRPPETAEAPEPQGGIPWPPQPPRRTRTVATRPIEIDGAAWPTHSSVRQTGMNKLRAAAVRAGRGDEVRFSTLTDADAERHPLTRAVEVAFNSVQAWDELVELANRWQADTLIRWLATNANMREQIERRAPTDPRSIGGLEASLQSVKLMVKDRASQLTNTVRTQRMLDLMTLHVRGVADERTYALRLTEALAASGGVAPQQRVGVRNAPRLHL